MQQREDLPLVTVVTPSYNQGQFIETTIRSVLEQDYPNVEYIICDGGSTDGSVDIIRKYEDRLAWWCSEPDGGQSAAINKGMRKATGAIAAWLNSDDTLLPGCLSTVSAEFERHPEAGMLYGGLNIINEDGAIIGHFDTLPYKFSDQLTHRIVIPQPAAFWRSEVAATVGPLRTDLHYAMDFEYWIRIGRQFQIVQIPQILAQFRISDNNKGTAQRGKWGPEFIRVLDELYADPHVGPSLRNLRGRAYAGAFTHGAAWFVAAGNYAEARRWVGRAALTRSGILMSRAWWRTALTALMGPYMHGLGRRAKGIIERSRGRTSRG